MTTYSFRIKNGRPFKVPADCFINALNKALLKFPGKRIIVNYSKAMKQYLAKLNPADNVLITKNGHIMSASLQPAEDENDFIPLTDTNVDLVTAKKEAVTRSKADKKKVFYINVDKDTAECIIEETANETTHAAYKAGNEIAIPTASAEAADKPTPISKAKTGKSATPAPATKEVAGKNKNTKEVKKQAKSGVAAKKAAAPAKKAATSTTVTKVAGKGKELTVKEILVHLRKGTRVLNYAGKSLTLGYVEKMKDPSRTMPVTVVS